MMFFNFSLYAVGFSFFAVLVIYIHINTPMFNILFLNLNLPRDHISSKSEPARSAIWVNQNKQKKKQIKELLYKCFKTET